MPVVAFGQQSKSYVTKGGDTVKAGTKVIINRVSANIYPKYDGTNGDLREAAAQRYLNTVMPGKEYKIERVSTIKRKSSITNIAIVRVIDPSIHRAKAQEYIVVIEPAIANGDVSFNNNY